MAVSKHRRVLRGLLAIAMSLGCTFVMAQDAWVLGSWVNLRSAAATTAGIKAQLTTNTPLQMMERQGDWCAVRVASIASEGYILCSLISSEPLTLSKAVDQPARAFWIAPSVRRLVAYGGLLRTGAAYNRMYKKLQDGEKAVIQPLPEFDAAKRLMTAGVIPNVDSEINRLEPVAPEAMEFFALLKPAPIKSSFFKAHGDIVLRSEGSADSLAAVALSKLSMKVTAPPEGYTNRHEGPEISGISGFGDVGKIELNFSPRVLVYSLLPNGLLGGAYLSKHAPASHPEYGDSCGMTYMGGGIGAPMSSASQPNGESLVLELAPAAGFPPVPDSMLPMASFVMAKPLDKRKLSVKSRAARVPNLQKPKETGIGQEASLPFAIPKVVLHEVDFDGDGVADMLVWDAPSIGGMSGAFNLRRAWYLNIAGKWYAAGAMDEQECT